MAYWEQDKIDAELAKGRTIEDIEEEMNAEEARDEVKKELQNLIDNRAKDLQRLSEDAYTSVEMFGVRMKTASGFIEAKNMLCSTASNLYTANNEPINATTEDIIDLQQDTVGLLEEITNDLCDINIYTYADYLDKFVERDIISRIMDCSEEERVAEIAWQSMVQAICRAVDEALDRVLQKAVDSEHEIKNTIDRAVEQGIQLEDLPSYTSDGGSLYLSLGEKFWEVHSKKKE